MHSGSSQFQDYSTFGNVTQNPTLDHMQSVSNNPYRQHYRSDSQIAAGAHTIEEEEERNEMSRNGGGGVIHDLASQQHASMLQSPSSRHSLRSRGRPGVIIRQSTSANNHWQSRVHSSSTSREYGCIVRAMSGAGGRQMAQVRNRSVQPPQRED